MRHRSHAGLYGGLLRGGINVPNTPGNLLKEVNGKDTAKVMQSTFLQWATVAAAIFALVGALYVTLTQTVTKNIAMIFLWVLFAILALGLVTIWFNVQNFQLVLGMDTDDEVVLRSKIESSCRGSRRGTSGGSYISSSMSTNALPSTTMPAVPSSTPNSAVSNIDKLVGL